jgi:dihydrofolate reductase
MRKIILMMSVSLDGFIEGPDRELDWHMVDDELHSHFNEQLSAMGAFLNGRVTYELMAGFLTSTGAAFFLSHLADGDESELGRLANGASHAPGLDHRQVVDHQRQRDRESGEPLMVLTPLRGRPSTVGSSNTTQKPQTARLGGEGHGLSPDSLAPTRHPVRVFAVALPLATYAADFMCVLAANEIVWPGRIRLGSIAVAGLTGLRLACWSHRLPPQCSTRTRRPSQRSMLRVRGASWTHDGSGPRRGLAAGTDGSAGAPAGSWGHGVG